ncbi:MAG: nucleoside deaminase [candidate division WOR-3 bacterium]
MKESCVPDAEAMKLAIAAALEGIERGQTPFGCCIVKDQKVLATAHNTVWQEGDPTRHAEINAISTACRALGTIDLSGASLYATCEPCPMCWAAAHWARVSRVVFGARIADARSAGFNELVLPAQTLKELSGSTTELVPDFMARECRDLFRLWQEKGRATPY